MKNLKTKKNEQKQQNNEEQQNDQLQKKKYSKPRSPGMFITNDPKKLSELPAATEALINRQPLSKNKMSPSLMSSKEALSGPNLTLKRTSSLSQKIEPKYTITRTPSNMSLNLPPLPNLSTSPNLSNAKTSSTGESSSRQTNDFNKPAIKKPSQQSLQYLKRLPDFIEIASERESNIRNYEIEQFRSDEIDLKEQFNDLLQKMDTLQRTLNDLESREMEEVKQKREEAEIFERETREKIEQLKMRNEEIERDANRLSNRLKELKNLKRETEINKNLNNKMSNEMLRCLRKLSKQYENGCNKYIKELQQMEFEATERRNRDRELMDQYKQKQNELAVLLEEKMILRKSLEERNQLEKILGQNGISLLVANQNEQQQENAD